MKKMSKKVCPPPASLTEYVNNSININNEVDGNMELAIFVGSIVVLGLGLYSLSHVPIISTGTRPPPTQETHR